MERAKNYVLAKDFNDFNNYNRGYKGTHGDADLIFVSDVIDIPNSPETVIVFLEDFERGYCSASIFKLFEYNCRKRYVSNSSTKNKVQPYVSVPVSTYNVSELAAILERALINVDAKQASDMAIRVLGEYNAMQELLYNLQIEGGK